MQIKIEKTSTPKPKVSDEALGFGKVFTDHMFVMEYRAGQGWGDARIVPYAPLPLEPSASCLHYALEVFEGMKAYRHPDDSIALFRPELNFARLNLSCDRLCIPAFDEGFALKALKELVAVDATWVPRSPGTSLYIRPFVIAVTPCLGVKPADHFLFIIIMSPVGSYYAGGLHPIDIFVETEYVRAVAGGVGHIKAGGNYAASIKSQAKAAQLGCAQVMWLDAIERRYIEEVGAMNVFFKIGTEVVTPALSGSILSGITRRSCMELLRSWGHPVSERQLSIDEVAQAGREGRLAEAFGTGTAAAISPIGSLLCGEERLVVGDGGIGPLTQKLYDNLVGIQVGLRADNFGWVVKIDN